MSSKRGYTELHIDMNSCSISVGSVTKICLINKKSREKPHVGIQSFLHHIARDNIAGCLDIPHPHHKQSLLFDQNNQLVDL